METKKGIVNGIALPLFVKKFNKMQIGTFTNDKGDEFKSCIFTDKNGEKTFVNFSSVMGELSGKQIKEMFNDLQVVTLTSGKLKLCKQGETWETVDLPGLGD
jgi:hypothetical protein